MPIFSVIIIIIIKTVAYQPDTKLSSFIRRFQINKHLFQTSIFFLQLRLYKNQKQNKNHVFTLPADYQILFDQDPSAIVIAGVNLNRYTSTPDYVLRKPEEFMIALVHKWDSEMKKLIAGI